MSVVIIVLIFVFVLCFPDFPDEHRGFGLFLLKLKFDLIMLGVLFEGRGLGESGVCGDEGVVGGFLDEHVIDA